MRILFITHSFNSLTQRLYYELAARGHEISIEFDIADSVSEEAVGLFRPDLIIAPFLKRAIPESIWSRHLCLVVHPGIVGDRGPSALDWAIQNGVREWGVTVLQAEAEMDAGPVWASARFPMRPARKASIYRNEVTEAALQAVLAAVDRKAAADFVPERVPGQAHALMRQTDRAIAWQTVSSAAILAKLNAADGFPGVADELFGQPCHLFDAWPEGQLKGERAACSVAVKPPFAGRPSMVPSGSATSSAPGVSSCRRRKPSPRPSNCRKLPLPGYRKSPTPTWQDIAYEEAAGVGS